MVDGLHTVRRQGREMLRRFRQDRDFGPPSKVGMARDDLPERRRHLSGYRVVQRVQVGSGGCVHEPLGAGRYSKTIIERDAISAFRVRVHLHCSLKVEG